MNKNTIALIACLTIGLNVQALPTMPKKEKVVGVLKIGAALLFWLGSTYRAYAVVKKVTPKQDLAPCVLASYLGYKLFKSGYANLNGEPTE